MKKIVTPFLLTLGLINLSNAQTQLPNVGYENWQNVGSNTEEPNNWNSNETGGGFATWGPQTCFRSTTAHSGTYSAELRTLTYLGNAVNGSITTGKIQAPSTTPSQGYIETVRNDANFNAPFTGRPDSLVGYFMYTQAGTDQGKVEVILHGDYNVRTPADAGSIPYIVGTATFLGPQANVGTWTRFSVPFTYANGNNPMYALAVATSSSTQATAVNGSKMWVDDIQVIYNPAVSITSIIPSTTNFCLSNTLGLNISVPFSATGTFNSGNIFTLELSDATGNFTTPTTIGSLASTASGTINATIPSGIPNGNAYRLRIVSSTPSIISPVNSVALTINSQTSGIDVITGCDTYTWIDNVTYTSSNNTATHTLTNAAGCDSLVTLNLTINNNTGTDVITACDSLLWIDGIKYFTNNTSATHTLTNVAGCDSVVTLNLTINSADNSVTQNGNTLTANANGASYQWVDCNNGNAAIAGETNQSYTALASGDYAVEVTENGCTSTSTCFNVSITNMNEQINAIFSIYPNPATNSINITMTKQLIGSEYVVMDAVGKVVMKGVLNTDNSTININELSQGLYFFSIGNDMKHTAKIIKQ